MKKIIFLLTFMIYTSWTYAQQQPTSPHADSQVNEQRLKLKNSAFCSCLYFSYLEEEKNDTAAANKVKAFFLKDGSSSGYFQRSPYPVEVVDTIRLLGKQMAKVTYKSENGHETLVLMKCLDFYNSSKLDSAVRRFDKRIIYKKIPR